jgi:hypothetical protein
MAGWVVGPDPDETRLPATVLDVSHQVSSVLAPAEVGVAED